MAIIDAKLFFGDILLNSGNSTLASGLYGDVINIGAAGKDGWGNTLSESPGEGQSMYLNVNINTVVGGAAGWVKLCQDGSLSTGALASPILVETVALASGTAVGTHFTKVLPTGYAYDQYLQISAGATATTGRADCWLSDSPTDSKVTLK